MAKGNGTSRGSEQNGAGKNGRQKAPRNSPVRSRNQLPWSGEPLANYGEPGPGKSGKCIELRDASEVSAEVRIDPETSGSTAGVQVGSHVKGTRGNVETVAPWPPAADEQQSGGSGSRVGTPANVRVECRAPCPLTRRTRKEKRFASSAYIPKNIFLRRHAPEFAPSESSLSRAPGSCPRTK